MGGTTISLSLRAHALTPFLIAMIMGVCVGASPAVARPGAEIQPERTGANVVPEPAPSSGAVDSHKPLFRPLAPNADAARALALRDPKAASTGGGAIRTVLSLGLVLGLIALAGAVFKRFLAPRLGLAASLGGAGRSPAGLLEILGRYPVGSGGALVLLKLDRRILLLSQQRAGRVGLRSGGGGFTPLCEITEPEELASILAKAREASGESISSKFRSLLGKFEQTAREHDPEPSARGCTPAVLSDVVQFSRDAVAGPTGEAPAARAPLPDATESLRLRLATMRIRGAKA